MRGTVAGATAPVHGAIVSFLLLLLACHGPLETGPHGMVGQLVDYEGAPIVDQQLNSVEAQARTDAEGQFEVRWKAPETLVHFERHGVRYQRGYRTEDAGKPVLLTLPQTRAITVYCPEIPCRLGLEWDLGHGFLARWSTACAAGARPTLGAAPSSTPTMSCEGDGVGDLLLEDRGSALFALPRPVPLRVRVVSADGDPPTGCTVQHGSQPLQPTEEGFYVAQVNRDAHLYATCEGRPAMPIEVPYDAGSATLTWSRSGPWIDAQQAVPGHGAGQFRLRDRTPPLQIEVTPDASGRLLLPPLPAGMYSLTWPESEGQPPLLFRFDTEMLDGRLPGSLD